LIPREASLPRQLPTPTRSSSATPRFLDSDNNDSQSEKQTFSITASQYISALSLNLYVEPAPSNLVDEAPSNTGSLTAGYNFDLGRWKNLGVSASFSKTHYEDREDDTQFSLSACRSIPTIASAMTCATATT
jgi:outer membrane usher protein FimD/PapC